MKKILVALFCLAALVLSAAGAASWWVMRQMGPDIWVQQAEKNWNCRAQIDEASLNLLTSPATLVFKGVHLARRDAEADKPLPERARMEAATADIYIAELRLEVRLEDLLKKRVHVENLAIIEPVIRETQTPDGSTLEALFKKPRSEKTTSNAAAAATANTAPSPAPPPASAPAAPEQSLPLDEDPAAFSFALAAARIERGSFFMNARDTTVHITGLDYSISGLDMDTLKPGDELDTSIKAHVAVTGMTRIQGVKRKAEIALLDLTGEGRITPLHPQTREWKPSALLTLTLAKGSILGGQQTIGDAAGKDLRKLEEFGIDLAPVPIGGPLQQDAPIQARWVNGALILPQGCLFVFPDYEVALAPKSWLDTGRDTHELDIRLSCGPELQERLHTGIAGARLGRDFARGLIAALSDKRGRLTFDIKSRGSLSDPKVTPDTDRALKNLMSGQGLGDLLKGFLK